ncbi:MAG: hypothetical protein KDJ75_03085 [Alphaproteobacteria bacterium]|nr:hypothetical protein [Alphaproteobacteria bacterium]
MSLRETFGKNNGSNTHRYDDVSRIFAQKGSGFDSFARNATNSFLGSNSPFETRAQADAPKTVDQPDVTTFSKENFHIDAVKPENLQTAGKPGAVVNADPQSLVQQAQDVAHSYMETDRLIKATAIEAMKEAVGEGAAMQVAGQLGDGGVTHAQAAATVLDPTGVAGSVYAVLSAIRDEMKAFPPGKVEEVMALTLDKLRASAEDIKQGRKPEIDIPDGLDFSKVDAKGLVEFFDRDIEKDPVIQQVREIETAMNEVQDNQDFIEENEHSGDPAEKWIDALANEDKGAIKTWENVAVNADAVSNLSNPAGSDAIHMSAPTLATLNQSDVNEIIHGLLGEQRRVPDHLTAPDHNRESELHALTQQNLKPGLPLGGGMG